VRAPGWRPLSAVLGAAGVLHLARPVVFEPLIPRWLGAPAPWVYGSGFAEIACAAGLLSARTRKQTALAAALLFVVVFPGNVQMAVSALRSAEASTTYRAITVSRLPLQVPLVLWALAIRRRAGQDGAGLDEGERAQEAG
jgi:uncharacterized membrane protein